jgi:hypothetical protein
MTKDSFAPKEKLHGKGKKPDEQRRGKGKSSKRNVNN